MRIFDLSFSDGRTCRVIDPDPEGSAEESLRGYQSMFQPGYLVGMVQVVAPPPTKLPWKRVANDRWELNGFKLRRCKDDPDGSKVWCLNYADQTLYATSKDDISTAVREHWHLHA